MNKNKTLILQKFLGAALLVLCIIATLILRDFTILILCAPFYMSGLFSKKCVLYRPNTKEMCSNGSKVSG